MGDGGRTLAFSFCFERPLDTWARWFAVVPTRSYVRVDDHGFEAVYGLWRVATTWSNVADVQRTGPYKAWKVAGPARMSLADRGITMAATTAGGACLRLRQPVPGIEPLDIIKHPSVTLGVDDLDTFIAVAQERIAAAGGAPHVGAPPDHAEGGYVGALRSVWTWSRRQVAHERREVARIEMPDLDRAGDADDQPVEIGTGPTFHRCYRRAVRDAAQGPDQAMAAIQADPNVLADARLAPFTKVRGASGSMAVGDRYVIEIAGPWKGAVEVVDVSPRSLRLATLEGHMESGVLEMRTSAEGDTVALTIESWARSHDRFLDVIYDKFGVAQALQGEMWSIACDRFAELVGGTASGPLEVLTERAT